MSETTLTTESPRKLLMRVLLMLLMCAAFQFAAWLLFAVAVLQVLFDLFTGEPNPRLRSFGGSVGRYLCEIADFASFRTHRLPFPFSDWPVSD